MNILVDADACPNAVKEILVRAVDRVEINMVMVANQFIQTRKSKYISSIIVPQGADVADDKIVDMVKEGDLVITADIPLADRVVTKGAYALNPRGEFYTEENIKQRLSIRDFMDELRSSGIDTGGAAPYNNKNSQAFANQLDRFLTKHIKKA